MAPILEKLNITVYNDLLSIAFFCGLILMVAEVYIYRNTFISYAIPTFIWLLTGLLITPFLSNTLAIHYNTKALFLQIVFNAGSWGSIVVFLFMWLNFHFASPNLTTQNVPINSTGHMAKGSRDNCAEPYVEITYNGVEKQLVYPCDVQIEAYKTVQLKTATGLWGYDIIKSKNLLK